MDVIPVLDLQGGRAVHARRGDRRHYDVVRGVLGTGDDPVALATAVRDRLGCDALYIADLDAIAGDAPPAIETLTYLANTGLSLLVDAGIRSVAEAIELRDAGAAHVVVGLETLDTFDTLASVVGACGPDRTIFSLDVRDGRPLASAQMPADTSPVAFARAALATGLRDILVLDLARVGSTSGPPLATVGRIRDAFPYARLLAGGGVRDLADLEALAAIGCTGALVATAIHDGTVGRAELEHCRAIAAATPGSAPTDRSSPPPPS